MHIISIKLLIETVYWNWLAILINIFALMFYYISVVGGNMTFVAEIFQPEINGVYFDIM